ncbi:autotransporter outer membrane beta-barrel domain-containing protein [Sphingobium nicotianae]|uniref:Autotransporter domain-containing protein n=1 Tax=Sphingobium nicotianae TaxID=2782607 RepID=A0A9X1DCW4_9SPHN|nr:autotransporter outer membrane beta-barrel domain-containing protein [Sphingobium nicotianae]MBT2187817.1 autotransporter domain-containing protein [Sphingobium nicotianae]
MRHFLLASTCCIALATAGHAETTITTTVTTSARTSTANSGTADDIHITSTGVIQLTGTGPGVLIDSANKVNNEGSIAISNADGATGIVALAGASSGISNAGKITVDETYTATDTDNDGDLDGPFAVGTGRTGIATSGAFTGNITQTTAGSISVEGNDSYGIRLGGPLTGNFSHDGTTTVLGDRAIGVQAGSVSGNVRLAGTVSAQGVDAIGARFGGDIGGTLTIQGAISATGYRYTTVPASTATLDADDLLQGGSAVIVQGNVAGGIILAKPPTTSTTDTDVDKDGILDANETTAAVTSYGAAPAMVIGSASQNITIGAVPATGTGYGLIVDGGISGIGLYTGVAATGLQVGGLGGTVNIAGGIGVTGTISATSTTVSATGIRIGAGATTPLLQNTGTISGTGSNAAGSLAAAIIIDQGGSLPNIKNGGTIKAVTTGVDGSATAILDKSNTLTLIENSGTISATGATAGTGRNIAIDLSGNTADGTIKQTVVTTTTAPSITGDIRFGSGNNLLDLADGTVTGNTYFQGGADKLNLSGDTIYTGNVFFGTGGATMALAGTSQFSGISDFGGAAGTLNVASGSIYTGSFANAGNLAVTLAGGKLDVNAASTISSLTVNNKGILGVTLGVAGTGVPILTVTGTASFDTGSVLAIKVKDINTAVGTHVALTAGTLTGASNVTANTTLVPFLYTATLSTSGNNLNVTLGRKSTSDLGLNRSEAAAFDPVYAALSKDANVAGAFLSISDGDTFRSTLRQMLPDHAGGTFQAVVQGVRTFSRMLDDPTGPFKDEGKWGYWINQIAWGGEKGRGDTAAYETSGWGIGAGGEIKTGLGNFGASLAYYWGRNRGTEAANEVVASTYELAGYWRLKKGGLRATARGSVGIVDLDGTRNFSGMNGTTAVALTASGDRTARLYSASGTLSYDFGDGSGIALRPVVNVDYFRLHEKGYAETGGGDAFNLIVGSRTSEQFAVTGSGVIGLNFGGEDQWAGWSRLELEAGRREIVGGKLGNTVAQFNGGTQFTLLPEDQSSGWVGHLRGVAGNSGFQVGGELGAEQYQSDWALSIRASLRIGL